MNIQVTAPKGATRGTFTINGKSYPCSLGRSGIVTDKHEGDGGTPTGTYPLRYVYYRPDRLEAPETSLNLVPLTPQMGWCDEPAHADYNREIQLPFAASHEELWREDHVYDVIIVIGHNDSPPVPGNGSAIFLHLERPEKTPTAGCVALTLPDMLEVLKVASGDITITLSE